jgi:hypothetical protein
LLFTGFKVCAQAEGEDFKSAMFEKKGGAVVAYSSEKHSFTLDLLSNNIKPQPKAGMVTIDNKVLQFIFIRNSALKDSAVASYQKAALLGYVDYELKYIKDELKMDYTNVVKDWIVINNKLFLFWQYDMPESMAKKKSSTQKQMNLSSLCFGHILNLNTPVLKEDSLDDDKALLTKVANTYTPNDFPTDFNELYKKLHGE